MSALEFEPEDDSPCTVHLPEAGVGGVECLTVGRLIRRLESPEQGRRVGVDLMVCVCSCLTVCVVAVSPRGDWVLVGQIGRAHV